MFSMKNPQIKQLCDGSHPPSFAIKLIDSLTHPLLTQKMKVISEVSVTEFLCYFSAILGFTSV